MSAPDGRVNGHGPLQIVGGSAARHALQGDRQVTPTGWSANRLLVLSLVLCALVSAADAILGHRVVLIGLLIVGPCSAAFTGRWSRVALAGAWAVGLAVVLGLPDGIWGTATHLGFLGAVVVVAVVSTIGAAVVERIAFRR